MRTRKRICAAVLTAVFAAVLCLTGCAPRAYELYEGTWEGEDIALGDLGIKTFTMTLTPCEKEPAWDEYDTLFADDIRYLVTFTVNGEECETTTLTYYGKDMKSCIFTWQENIFELSGQLFRAEQGRNVFEGRLRLYQEHGDPTLITDWTVVDRADVVLAPQ